MGPDGQGRFSDKSKAADGKYNRRICKALGPKHAQNKLTTGGASLVPTTQLNGAAFESRRELER